LHREQTRRRIGWALLLSLGLHGLVLLYVALRPPPPPLPASHDAIELQVIELPPTKKPEPAPQPTPPEPPATASAQKKKPSSQKAPQQQANAAATPQHGGARGAGASSPDSPRSMTLVPGSDFPVAAAGEPEGPRGHTVTNGPGEEPDSVAMNEYTSEKLTRRTKNMLEGMAGRARAGAGVVDPYFMGARKAMEGDMSSSDVPKPNGTIAHEAVKGYLNTVQQYGRTGNPLGGEQLSSWGQYSLERGTTQGMAMAGKDATWAGLMGQAEQSMAAAEATKRSLDHAALTAELELVQEPNGGIADSHIVKSSGYKDFDEFILHHARKVFLKLEDPPEKGHGISAAGWRSYWRFSYYPPSIAEKRGQRVRVELLRVEAGQGGGNPFENTGDE
jgi:hypothetical protein